MSSAKWRLFCLGLNVFSECGGCICFSFTMATCWKGSAYRLINIFYQNTLGTDVPHLKHSQKASNDEPWCFAYFQPR